MRLADLAGVISPWFFWAFWISFAVAAIVAKPILSLLIRLKSRQTISQYVPEGHAVKQGTPTMGGLIILAGAVAGAVAVLVGAPGRFSEVLVPALVLLVGFGLVGFVDDYVVPRLFTGKRGLGWTQKLAMQIALTALAGYLVYGANVLAIGLFLFCVLFYSNAYNFSDGLDGLAGSLLIGLVAGFFALIGGSPYMIVLPLLLGGLIPFLFLNAPPAKVFMGDAGSLPIGAVLGMLASTFIHAPQLPGTRIALESEAQGLADAALTHMSHTVVGWLALLVLSGMMIVELVPVPLQILSVKIRKKKLFFYTPIHHGFEKKGWPESRVVWTFALCQLLLSALAASIAWAPALSQLEAKSGKYHYYYYSPEGRGE